MRGCALTALISLYGFGAGFLSSATAYNGKMLNGKAVSVRFRYGSYSICEGSSSPWRGALVVYTLRNSQVVRGDTIHERQQGFAHYPAFNLSGTKIAFYRFGQALAASGDGCASVNGGRSYISLINPDGSGLTDLCELPGQPSGEIFPLDWPGGDWIYYTRPHDAAHSFNGLNSSTVIWRVNAVTGANEPVCNLTDNGTGIEEICNSIRRFTMSVDGDYMGLMYVAGGKGGCTVDVINNHVNSIHPFPPSNCAIVGTSIAGAAGCNISISPSGKIHGSYFAGSHDQLMLGTVRSGPDVPLPRGVWIDAPLYQICAPCIMEGLAGSLTKWSGDYIGNGAELIRWSANSDKWVMQKIGMYHSGHASNNNKGSNQILCNWVDSVAINISKNPVPPYPAPDGYVFLSNDAGDVWVSDPANNPNGDRYEDLQGRWHTVDGTIVDPYVGVSPPEVCVVTERDSAVPDRQLEVSNTGVGSLNSVTAAMRYGPGATDWVSAAVSGTGDNRQIALQFGNTSFPAGTYRATLLVTATGSADTAFVPVGLVIQDHRDPENPPNVVEGLVYGYYEGEWFPPPDFGSLTPQASGTCTDFDVSTMAARSDDYGFRFEGYIDVPVQGLYTFTVAADDVADMYLGSDFLLRSWWEEAGTATIALKAGKHAVRVDYCETEYAEGLSVSWECEKAGIGKQEIPASRLYRTPEASVAARRPMQLSKPATAMILYTVQGKRVGRVSDVRNMQSGLPRPAGRQILLAVPENRDDRTAKTAVIVR